MAIKLHESIYVHPGPFLRRNFVEESGLTISALAKKLDVGRHSLSRLLNGRSALSAAMALRFERAFGISAATMLRMQAAHDLGRARKEIDLENVEEITA